MKLFAKSRYAAAFVLAALLIFLLCSCASKKNRAGPASVTAQSALEGTAWTLKAIMSNSALVVLQEDDRFKILARQPEIVFGPEGVFSGFTGVNRLASTYAADSKIGSLKIAPGALTRMAAFSLEAAAMEQIFVDLLQNVSAYSAAGNELTFYDIKGAPLMVLAERGE
ncbi:MAG: META domain-containing protein [Treponema sp.]|jgi:heat shock protein HslJ|nr:META domain-containing protein [Treponema sp.]